MRFAVIIGVLLHSLLFNVAWSDSGDQYSLAKLGGMTIENSDADVLWSAAFTYGVGLTPSITVEAELALGLDGGDFKNDTEQGEFDIWTVSTQLVYRYRFNQTVYAKLKGGLIYEDVELSGTARQGQPNSKGLGGGGGAGMGFVIRGEKQPIMVEIEFTIVDEDINFYSIGMTSPF